MIDLEAGQLRIDGRPVELRRKTWAVVCALATHPGRLVTKDELFAHVWPGIVVSESALSKTVGELRAVLDDSRESPRWIETVSGRGFRWIGPAQIVGGDDPARAAATAAAPFTPATIVGRDHELTRLDHALARARRGTRQVVFVAGEAGSGKTTVVDHFLGRIEGLTEADSVMVAHGLCVESSGPYEPYLPVFDALERLARDERHGAAVLAVLRRCAPSWFAQMPILSSTPADVASKALQPGSMLRELITSVDEITRSRPLIFVLEDAHWADIASTDALSALARRRDPARLLLVVTMRPADAMIADHPIVGVLRDVVGRGGGDELALAPFGDAPLRDYLARRCTGIGRFDAIVRSLLQQTGGNPLFVRLVVDEWVRRKMVVADETGLWAPAEGVDVLRNTIPDSLRSLLELQIRQLAPDERAVLESASVRAGEFVPAAIAAEADMDPDEADAICDRLARRGQLLRSCGHSAANDGSVAERYAFLHAVMQNVVCESVPSAKRRRLHLSAAEQIERENVGKTSAVSGLLALHYEAAGDAQRTVRYLRESARMAMHRDAPRDAVAILERLLELLDANPSLPDPDGERIAALSNLSHARQLAFGFLDAQVARLWSHTSELAAAKHDERERVLADAGRIVVACVSGHYSEAEDIICSSLPLMDSVADAGVRKTLCFAAGTVRYRMGAMDDTRRLFELALGTERESEPVPGSDLTALLLSQYAPAVALAGRPDEVRSLAHDSLQRARAHSHYSECNTATLVAWALALLHDFQAAAPIAARALELSEADNFRTWTTRPSFLLAMAQIYGGAVEDGIDQARASMDGRRQDGQWVDHSAFCCLFAEALLDTGRHGAAELVETAAEFVATSGELYYECEIFRLRAKLEGLERGATAATETLLQRAIELATLRGMHWHRLLAASDLAAAWSELGRDAEAVSLLAPAIAAITGGQDLEAVRRAARLLAACRGAA